MRINAFFLYLALVVFLASAAAIILSLERGSRWLALAGALGNLIAGICFALSIWLPRRKVDWKRIEAEQRLWESGPLGRRWLGVRRRIYRLWKF